MIFLFFHSAQQVESELEKEMSAICLSFLLNTIGPMLDQAECHPVCDCFKQVREQVLSPHLSVHVKSILLDLLLLRAAGWSHDSGRVDDPESEASTEITDDDDDVVIEPGDSDDELTTPGVIEKESDSSNEQGQGIM